MGLYDRDYYQAEDTPRGFHVNGQRMMVTNIVILTVAIFIVDAFTQVTQREPGGERYVMSRWLSGHLTLGPDVFQRPWNAWQLLSYGFAHTPVGSKRSIFHIGFNMFLLWMFGRVIEQKYGPMEFLRFYLLSLVFAGLVWVLIQNLVFNNYHAGGVLGASGGVTAVVILFVLNFPNQTLMLVGVVPIKAWVFGCLCVGLDFLSALGVDDNVAHEAHLAGAAFGFGYFYFGLNFGRLWPRKLSTLADRLKPRPNLKVHDPDAAYEELDHQADRLLDKVHQQGEDSLTTKERRILEDYSRRMRQKRR